MIVLVTGGSGLIGKAIESIKASYNYDFIFLSSSDCDLTNLSKTKEQFNKIKPDYVIHLAANVGGLFKNMNQKVDMFEKNLLINYNVIKCCHDFKIKKLISCLSTCIFPNDTTYPINESMLHNGAPHNSNDAYSYAKRMIEVHSKAYREQYNDNFVCVIPTNIYGEYDNFSLEDGHVVPALIHKCYLAKQNNEPFVVFGSGKPLRQFIYSIDLAKLILWVLENYSGESIILSPNENEEVSIKNVAELIAKEFDYDNIKFDTSKSDGQFKKTADNTKLIDLYGEFKFTTIEDGIKKSVNWFMNNYKIARK
jgi:GDP-L-fucose synthase